MTDAIFPQCRIDSIRLLNPETVESLLNEFVKIPGIRRMVLNGPRLPAAVPYGPTRGSPNPHVMRRKIKVGGQDLELAVHVGTFLLELETRDIIPQLKEACDKVLTAFPYSIKEGRFMKTEPSLVDYARYGPEADKDLLGLTDPKSRQGPVILQGVK
jgi:methyl-coenzyme M reductase subunit D